jgi:hypothetical protein
MSAHVRMASAMTTLFDRMDEDTAEAGDSLTGLQVLLMRVIATKGARTGHRWRWSRGRRAPLRSRA